MKTLNDSKDLIAATTPCRNDCHKLVTNVGTIKAASAISGGKTIDSPDIITIGMANPTEPFTTPAKRVIKKAKPSTVGVVVRSSWSIDVGYTFVW